jgi:hypothetical protein
MFQKDTLCKQMLLPISKQDINAKKRGEKNQAISQERTHFHMDTVCTFTLARKLPKHENCLNNKKKNFIHPAAPRGATKPFCPRRKGAGPSRIGSSMYTGMNNLICWRNILGHRTSKKHPLC